MTGTQPFRTGKCRSCTADLKLRECSHDNPTGQILMITVCDSGAILLITFSDILEFVDIALIWISDKLSSKVVPRWR
jgi:hypothetical protein